MESVKDVSRCTSFTFTQRSPKEELKTRTSSWSERPPIVRSNKSLISSQALRLEMNHELPTDNSAFSSRPPGRHARRPRLSVGSDPRTWRPFWADEGQAGSNPKVRFADDSRTSPKNPSQMESDTSLATPRTRAYTFGLLQNSAPKLVWRAGGLSMVVLFHRQPNRVFRLRTPQGFT